jgi:Tfp pilus assembly ATPase PilU
LYKAGTITHDEALRNADSQNNLRLKISLAEGNAGEIDSSLKIEEAQEGKGPAMGLEFK